MATFIVTRKQFIDRTFTGGQLDQLARMLVGWWMTQNRQHDPTLSIHAEATIFALPRSARPELRDILASHLPDASFDESDPDQLTIIGQPVAQAHGPDLSVWHAVLSEPAAQHTCLLLRLTLRGTVNGPNSFGPGQATLVLCGAPADGSLNAKAIWSLRSDPAIELLFRLTPWQHEQAFLAAFDLYCIQLQSHPPALAAEWSFNQYKVTDPHLFAPRKFDRNFMWILRSMAELPDQHGLRAFVLRGILPLAIGAAALICAIGLRLSVESRLAVALLAAFPLQIGGRAVLHKFGYIHAYHSHMHAGLGALHSNPVRVSIADNSASTDVRRQHRPSKAELRAMQTATHPAQPVPTRYEPATMAANGRP